MNEEIKTATEVAKDPLSYSAATYLWVLLFAMWGGVVRVVREVIFEGKTKKNVDRGKWRFLTEKEVRHLKYFKKGK